MTATATDGVFASQAAFRALMEAFARPGEIKAVRGVAGPPPLAPAAAAVVQSLADYETPIWLDPPLAETPAVGEWIRFHTGARLTSDPGAAAFALIADADALPDFASFALGSEEYPDRSTTLIVQVARFAGAALTLEGPGIRTTRAFAAEPLPNDFAQRLAANRELFPRGVDLVLVADDKVLALPRSVRLVPES